jgi:phospholipid/cholesterol/gamma-HCH transport system substrate-binding protein
MAAAGSRNVKVGAFVLAGLLLLGLVVFLLGQERSLFSPRVTFHTSFGDVGGLKVGAPVRLGGIDIGQVAGIRYSSSDPSDSTIYVDFWVTSAAASRVRTDAKARIATKGLLGDKMLEVTVGVNEAAVSPGAEVPSEPGIDVMGRVTGMADRAEVVMDNIARATKPLGDEQLHKDLQSSVASLNAILNEVAHGQGYPKRFLSDPSEAERISRTIDRFERTADEAQATLAEIRGILVQVKKGPGFAHDVIYGDGPKGLPEVAALATEVTTTLKSVRESKSLAHDMLYGGSGGTDDTIANVARITSDVQAIVSDVRAGKGTLGGLLVDPSVYEDVKVVLGNVQRNDVLRALVRYSIQKDTPTPRAEVSKK